MNRASTDLLRVLLIITVIIIHATSYAESSFQNHLRFLSIDGFGIMINQFARFSVTLFLLISGYSLTMKYQDDIDNFNSMHFYKKRLWKIGAPYVILSFLFFMLKDNGYHSYNGLTPIDYIKINITNYFLFLYIGKGDYHFYFFSIIIQCYLLFPLLLKFKSQFFILLFLVIQVLFTAPAHEWFHSMGIKRPGFASSFFIYWIFYFYAGIFMARHEYLISLIKNSPLYLPLLSYLISLIILFWEYYSKAATLTDPGNYNHFSRQSVILYSLASLALFIKMVNIPSIQCRLNNPRIIHWISILSGTGFFVYIFHTWFLRGVQIYTVNYIFTVPLVVTLSFLTGVLLQKIKLPEIIKTILGLPPAGAKN